MKGPNDMIVCDVCKTVGKPAFQMSRLHASLILDRVPNSKGQFSSWPIMSDAPRPDLCKDCGSKLGKELLEVLKKYTGASS